MLVLLSPAKSLDLESPLPTRRSTSPRLLEESSKLMDRLRKLSTNDLKKLMGISDDLAQLNHDRFASWESDHLKSNSRPALLTFAGDVYQGFDFSAWKADHFNLAQQQIRILSGLYGVLRPLDLIQPHRLEMGTKLKIRRADNLYQFWGDQITELLNQDLKKSGSSLVVNLASNEYFKSVNRRKLEGELITPVFKDEKNGSYKVISFFAKKARGTMADFIVQKNVKTVKDLRKFRVDGYRISASESDEKKLVFLRPEKVAK